MTVFALQKGASDKETKSLAFASMMNRENYEIRYFPNKESVPDNSVPMGTIDWVNDVLGYVPVPDVYPSFLEPIFNREIWRQEFWPVDLSYSVFIKPADKPKRYSARTTVPRSYRGKKKGPHWCSDIVKFGNEWRLYVQRGKIVYSGWYYPKQGEEVDCPQSYIDRVQSLIPAGWCGSIDIGEVEGKLTLVECGEPYSTGWYGHISEGAIYAEWLKEGWKWMKENTK